MSFHLQVEVQEEGGTQEKWSPCSAGEPGAQNMTWMDIPNSDDILVPPVTLVCVLLWVRGPGI